MEFQNETEAAEAEAWTGAGCAAPTGSDAERLRENRKDKSELEYLRARDKALDELVFKLTGDEGEDDSIEALKQYLANREGVLGYAQAVADEMRTALIRCKCLMEDHGWNPDDDEKLEEGWADDRSAEQKTYCAVIEALEADIMSEQHHHPDTVALNWLETRFTHKWRNSIFMGNELGNEGMLVMDERLTPGLVHRAKTVRGLIRLAMSHQNDESSDRAGGASK